MSREPISRKDIQAKLLQEEMMLIKEDFTEEQAQCAKKLIIALQDMAPGTLPSELLPPLF